MTYTAEVAPVAEQLTCEEIHTGFDALIKRIAELAAERDVAIKMATQATKDLVQARHTVAVRDAVIKSLRIDADDKNTEIRRLNANNRELAVENEDLRKQRDADQQEPRTVRTSWRSRRINQL